MVSIGHRKGSPAPASTPVLSENLIRRKKERAKKGVTARVTVALTSWKPNEVLVFTYGIWST